MIKTNLKSSYGQELLMVSELVAQEKDVPQEEILKLMEEAISKIAASQYSENSALVAHIDRATGDLSLNRIATIVEEIKDPFREMTLEDAQRVNPSAQLGEEIEEVLPFVDLGRSAAQNARGLIVQRIREMDRSRQYEDFKNRIGDITSVLVKRVEFGNVIVDIGKSEAILRKEDMIPRETFRIGDRLRAVITGLRPEGIGPMVQLSRTHPQFLAKLFYQEVPEVYDGVVEIKAVARDPGSRSKVAVITSDPNLDPIGTCVGVRGTRIREIINELRGEKIDVIPWSSSVVNFVVNALTPAEVSKVVIDEEKGEIEVIVEEEQLSLAIGRRGQNVRLASILTGGRINIITESADRERRAQETEKTCDLFIKALEVDEMFAQLLWTEGFTSIEDIVEIDPLDFEKIEGFDAELVHELQQRGRDYLEKEKSRMTQYCLDSGLSPELLNFELLSPKHLEALVNHEVLTGSDLGDLSGDELIEILGSNELSKEQANEVIMKARSEFHNK